MAVLICDCGSKVESNRCYDAPMGVKGEELVCGSCNKTVKVNNCCGKPMQERSE